MKKFIDGRYVDADSDEAIKIAHTDHLPGASKNEAADVPADVPADLTPTKKPKRRTKAAQA